MFNLTGKTAIVTGASGGIGGGIARALHAQGAKVLISGTKEESLKALQQELGDNIHYKTCNLRALHEVEELFAHGENLFGSIDIMVCNAGITKDGLAMRMKNEDFADVIQVNLIANFVLNRAAVKHMIKNKKGRIINIASIIGSMGNAGQANYSASKGGLIAMSKSLAQEVANRGITVNCIAPGFIETAMTEVLNEQQKEKMLQRIPCGRFGTPSDIAKCVIYLASDEAAYVNGQTIHVNGGMLMV